MSVISPLSENSNVVLIDTIKTIDLKRLYLQEYNIDISSEIADFKEIGLYRCIESDLNFFYPSITGSESFYEKFQKFEWYYMDEKNEYNYAAKLIKPFDSVLEIGCGKGAFAQKITVQNYVGLEFSQKAQELGTINGVTIKNESIEEHAASNSEKYDVVCAFQVLEHVTDIKSFINSSLACLKPSGLLIFSVPSLDSFSKYVCNFTLDMPPHHVTRWSDRALMNLSKYFPVENLEIWHEPLQQVHNLFYAETILKTSFFKLFNKEVKAIDFSIKTKLINLITQILGKLLANTLLYTEFLPRGISVTSVYRKLKSSKEIKVD